MKRQKIEYMLSAVDPKSYPAETVPEIAIAGRSNAGKSSYINAIAEREVAHVSKKPGKTSTLNFFSVGENYRLIDMPGYGFAVRSETERMAWQTMVELYATTRKSLVGIILIHDIRRDWEKPEIALATWLKGLKIPLAVGLSKEDKLLPRESASRMGILADASHADIVMSFSSLNGKGAREFEDEIFKAWVKTHVGKSQ
jgi:GTP-binding protein